MAAILYTDIRLNNYIKIEFCLKPETIIPLLHGTSQQKTTIQQKLIKYLMSLIILQHIIKIQMPKRKPLITNLAKPMVYIYYGLLSALLVSKKFPQCIATQNTSRIQCVHQITFCFKSVCLLSTKIQPQYHIYFQENLVSYLLETNTKNINIFQKLCFEARCGVCQE